MTRRIADQLAATLAGMLVGIVLMGILVPDAWAPTPRSSPQADPGPGTPRMTPDAAPSVPSPDVEGLAGPPDRGTRQPTLSLATGTRPAPTSEPRTSMTIRGLATWYAWRPGEAAAGPGLRALLGARWRGRLVTVAADGRAVTVRLTDWCACPGGRVVDLDRRSFAVLAPPSVGVLRVTVRPFALPDTSTEDDR